MSVEDILEAAEQAAGTWPTNMPGHVNFGAHALPTGDALPDGVHRAEGSAWQFVVEGGKIVQAVRQDLGAWWKGEHTVHGAPAPENPGSEDG